MKFVMKLVRLIAIAALCVTAPVALDAQAARPAAPQMTTPGVTNIDWRLLGQLDYVSGVATDTLRKLDGKKVRIPGFIVPLDDADEQGAEFLLVPYYGACVHTPPPPPNQMAFVTMTDGKQVRLALFDAIWMEGTLRIVNYESPYGSVGYTIEGLSMKPYTGR
jgi:hypothetical protein